MADIAPFSAYRYTSNAGPLDRLVTQPYDKISPAMQARYLSLSPYNLVRIILGQRLPSDSASDNVYTRAAAHLEDWIANGILARDDSPSLYAYSQEFSEPDSGETLVRQGFIGLGKLEHYSAGIVHRHEQTLSGPKKDRLELLRHTRAHFGQIFMLYPDPERQIDGILQRASASAPLGEVCDEYGTRHRLWRIAAPGTIQAIQAAMREKKLLIADGHHRYETALAFREENPDLPGSAHVMMTFVSMHSAGLRILATHRLVSGMPDFDEAAFLRRAAARFHVEELSGTGPLRQAWAAAEGRTVIGAAIGSRLFLLAARDVVGEVDVQVLHSRLLGEILGIGEDAVREERNLRYVRGLDAALEAARGGSAQIAFLLKPTTIQQVADISFRGDVMPQKSTDFYPKLLSGIAIYRF